MLILLSPAKIQNVSPQTDISGFTQPEFIKEAESLVFLMREMSPSELVTLMDINSKIAHQNTDRYYNWNLPFSPKNSKQAVLTYNGEVFHGLDAKSLSPSDIKYLQSHLRILSGLYGVLRPLDLIQPYRLEVSSKLKTHKGTDLYAFWRESITTSINQALTKSGEPKVLLNLASGEYFKAIDVKKLDAKVIDFEFLQSVEDKYKVVVVYTKKARGMMTRYVVENKIETIEDLKGFSSDGYWYNEEMSTERKMVFVR